jgi:recombination protein RecA
VALPTDIRKAMAEINKTHGDGTVVVASDIIIPDRITTGSLALDACLGGGFTVNQWHEVLGEASAGKTTLAAKTLGRNQKLDPKYIGLWVAAEWFDRGHAEMCGVDLDRTIVVNENIMEKAYNVVLKALREQWCDFICIDSLPAMTPGDEAEAAMEEATVALGARLTNKFFRKQGSAGKRAMDNSERPCTCLLINQWRDKIGIQWGDPRTSPGGRQKEYTAVTRLDVKRDEWIEIGPSGNRVRIGQTIKVRTMKNKTFAPQKVATYDFYFEDAHGYPDAGSYDTFKEIVGLGVVYDVIQQGGGGWYEYQNIRAKGLANFLAAIASDLDVADVLSKEVLQVATAKPHAAIEEPPAIEHEPAAATTPRKRTVTRTVATKTAAKKTARSRR